MSVNAENFEGWIRGPFVDMNTDLEEQYFAREARSIVEGVGDEVKGANS